MLHVLCNFLVTSVNCDELMESVGARGHFTHTWAVHIPGGEDVAKSVADDHGMIFRGRVSTIFILFLIAKLACCLVLCNFVGIFYSVDQLLK
jgi:hypothetical protein